MLTPVALLVGLFLGLLALALPLLGIWLLWKAAHPTPRFVVAVPATQSSLRDEGRVSNPKPDEPRLRTEVARPLRWSERWREPAILVPLIAGALLVLLPLGWSRTLVKQFFPTGEDEPHALRGVVKDLTRPDGTRIHVEVFGPETAPQLVLTHGWGTNSTEWYYAKQQLAGNFRVIVWDLPGMGETEETKDHNDSLEQMATDLHQVLTVAAGRPVVIVGHSIGGMTNLTFARLYPESLGTQVAGIVQVDTSYTNPVKTASHSELNQALQKPLAEPLLHAMVPLSALVHLAHWLSYQEGTLYLNTASSSFAGTETRGELEMVTRFQVEAIPAVVARGTLAMFHWDATPVLPQIKVPVLILVGKQDTTTEPAASETMQRTIPNARMQLIDPSRHYALLEKNRDVNQAIAQFATTVLH